MCTLSWLPHDCGGGYTLAFNRDERRTRAAGIPPARDVSQGVLVLRPQDPDGGGSWISLNQLGHSLALLNRHEDTPHDVQGEYLSRGGLVAGLAHMAGFEEVEAGLRDMTLDRFRPFTLASVGMGQIPALFEWNGMDLVVVRVEAPGLVRASSGSDQAAAERARTAVFRGVIGRLSAEALLGLHRSHLPEIGPLSICMHRNEACTVSLSHIITNNKEMSFRYVDGSPCSSTAESTLVL